MAYAWNTLRVRLVKQERGLQCQAHNVLMYYGLIKLSYRNVRKQIWCRILKKSGDVLQCTFSEKR